MKGRLYPLLVCVILMCSDAMVVAFPTQTRSHASLLSEKVLEGEATPAPSPCHMVRSDDIYFMPHDSPRIASKRGFTRPFPESAGSEEDTGPFAFPSQGRDKTRRNISNGDGFKGRFVGDFMVMGEQGTA